MNTINPDQLLAQMRVMAAQARNESATPAGEAGAPDFGALLKQSVDKVNDMQQHADQLATAFEKGDPNVDVAEVMVALQKAGVSFQAMVQVRNRLVSAYQDIMNMQV
jgi:flagellar hook-basal body complex protein FliE